MIKLYTVEEAAEILRCKPGWLASAARRGDIASRKIGRARMFTDDDLAEYLERVRREASNPWSLSRRRPRA